LNNIHAEKAESNIKEYQLDIMNTEDYRELTIHFASLASFSIGTVIKF